MERGDGLGLEIYVGDDSENFGYDTLYLKRVLGFTPSG